MQKQMGSASQTQEDAISLLQRDHRTVEALFKSYESAQSTNAKQDLAQQICMELIIHSHLEEEVFYAACRANGVEDDALDEAQVEHDGAKVMIGDLLDGSPEDAYYDAKVKVLKEYIRHHVNEEEKADGIFSKARQASLDLDELGMELKSMKEQLTAEGDAVAAAPLETPSLQLNNINNAHSEETQMPRQDRYEDEDDYRSSRGRSGNGGGGRMRDDDGRFMGDDDGDGRSSLRGRSSRSSYDDDEDSGGRGGRGRQNMDRDDQGRFMSDDEDDSRSSRGRASRSNYDDDDNGRGRQGRSSRGREDMERDDQGRFMSGDDDDGHSSRGRSSSGRSSRSSYDDDEDSGSGGRSRSNSGRGWYGDSEGHSRAAQQRQQSQSNYDDDDRGGRGRSQGGRSEGSRSQSSRSQGGRSQGQGHGGWFGDSQGHSQAARRGWRDRD